MEWVLDELPIGAYPLRRVESLRRLRRTSRAALSAMASSTGWISVGELAMTPKISLVAVCCSKRLFEFLEQPHVLDGDHRLVGEGFEQFDLRRGEGAHLGATRAQCSNEFPLLTKGNDKKVRQLPAEPNVGKSFCARTSGMWSVPCSRIQRNCGSSILISTRPMGMGPK